MSILRIGINCIISIIIMPSISLFAWSNHSLVTEIALKNLPEIKKDKIIVPESLNNFLNNTYSDLPDLFNKIENWSLNRKLNYKYSYYPATPKELSFNSYKNDPNIELKFLMAMRINPAMKFPIYLQLLPGDEASDRHIQIPSTEILLPEISKNTISYSFIKIEQNEQLSPLNIVTTASDEPDYGFDIGLFDDSPNADKLNYQFGIQPFGNPHLVFSSQAPFHMGFYQNSSLIYKAAPFLTKTYAEFRFYLFKELAQFAFKHGHPYWGYRFLGWSLHYIQDLTQPFHVTPLPGFSSSDLIAFNILDILEGTFIKTHKSKSDAINIISNRHLIYEQIVYNYLYYLRKNNIANDRLLYVLALPDSNLLDANTINNYIRETITKESNLDTLPTYGSVIFEKYNKDISSLLARTLPYKYVYDPEYIFDFNINTSDIIKNLDTDQKDILMNISYKLMKRTGIHTRSVTKYILQN
ncbi:hypothetical protein [Fluviispira multicolorata]|uniref:Zinc dependent phospholipase C n=1 Tax=Fluviispira multicolorata TaxID=2654512 RepID=A0A833N501_9BACT|nr:hypothetical protein [Fluviispira multicolorata]KAB8031973.1 hypothetical protein GCL57_04825 [Fluviispira multicolorata]